MGSFQRIVAFCGLCLLAVLMLYSAYAAVTLVANADLATCYRDRYVDIAVRNNDTYNGDGGMSAVSIAISTVPQHGTAVVLADKTIRYTPFAGYTGSDTFFYRLRATADGRVVQSIASVSLNVRGIIVLSWDPPPAAQAAIIQGYKMYSGPSCSSLSLKTDLSIVGGQVSIAEPRLNYNPKEDLGLGIGSAVSFAVKAYGSNPISLIQVESPLSNCVSTTVTRI